MALDANDQQMLKDIYRRLEDNPLEPGSPFYEPIYQRPEGEDPVAKLATRIDLAGAESLQLFSGFRGMGKTTELFRLKRDLEQKGCLVLYANALDYVSSSEEVDIVTLLMSIAGAFGEQLKDANDVNIMPESFWKRFTNYLTRTTVEMPEVAAKAETGVPAIAKDLVGDIKAGVDVKMALKTAPSFRQKLETFLANRLYELKAEVNAFIEDGVKRVRAQRGNPDLRIVLLFDQFEQIRGSRSNEQAVIQSVERLFRDHIQSLRLPFVHVIYTVPPWLQFVLPGAFSIETLPCVRLWKNDEARSQYKEGWNSFLDAIRKRFGQKDFAHVFGQDPKTADSLVAELIGKSGGHFRDLQRLFRETIVLILTWRPHLPVKPEVIERAIADIRSEFLPIAVDDARWLDKIAKRRDTALPDSTPESIGRLSRFLDTHLVLFLTNGKDWYDLHPLIREEVAALAKIPAPPKN
jgi:hypothetical protein